VTRVLVFSLFGVLAMVLLGPFQELFGLDLVVLDVPLIVVVYMAMGDRGTAFSQVLSRPTLSNRRTDWSGGGTAVVLGHVTDVLGAGTQGLHCLTLVVVFLVARRAARHVYLASTLSAVVVVSGASMGASFFGLAIRWMDGVQPTLGSVSVAGFQALLCAVFAPLVIRMLRFMDQRLLRREGASMMR